MLPLVSIIVPIYGVEPYIKKCVQSIMKQSYQNIEIILIDDGSPDNCGLIIDSFKQKDSRIMVIHKVNEGVSAARNNGLNKASGEYVMFIDGDDYVEPDYVEYFVSLIQDSNCEIAVGSNHYYKENLDQVEDYVSIVDSMEVVKQIYLGGMGVAVWNKIYNKQFLDKHLLRFNTDFWFAEGMLFNILCLQQVDTVVIGSKRVYHAVENQLSATRKFNLDSYFCGLRSMEYQRDHWIKTNQNIQMSWEYHYRKYAELILRGLLKTGTERDHLKVNNQCISILKSNLRIPIQADIEIWRKMDAICLAIDPEINIKGTFSFRECKSLKSKLNLFFIKVFYKIPNKYKVKAINCLEKYYKLHYKPKYLDRSLL